MRSVAVTIALLSLVAVFPPASSSDECAAPGTLSFCQKLDVMRPNPPPGVPNLPNTPYYGTYYLWVGAGHCIGTNLNDCRSYPPGGPIGVKLPAEAGGGTVGFGVFGMLFEESNGAPGLQRFVTSRPPDRMVLV
ncbi:MAG TPA: hypothetical protein VFH78_15330 [Candidatus Thermoplasmatota archaeon]|nr:hypothetical protein [Candidatus Thermoplasmatota archaeon]